MKRKTINLPESLNFSEALQAMLDGKCLGIRPGNNSSYVELFKPHWMNPQSPDYMLRWHGEDSDVLIRTNQFLGKWSLVIADHRTLITE